MTTCPLRVPTEELDSPEASRATPNRMAGVLPSSMRNCSKALSMSPTSVSPAEWKRAAAMMSMLALMVPEVGGEDNPQQQIPKLRPARDVRRKVPRVHVRNRSDKRRPEKGQELANPSPTTLQRLVRSPRSRTLPRQHSLDSSYHLVSPSTHENLYHLEFSPG
jgi:hypothetical protein